MSERLRICRRLLPYGVRRWPAGLAVLTTMLLATTLNVLKPWPMKVLVDHALGGRPVPAALSEVLARLPGAATQDGLIAWSVAATGALFLLGWALALATAYANIAFGQRIVYDVAQDLFAHMQRLSYRFHQRRPVGDSMRRVTHDASCAATIAQAVLLSPVSSLLSLAMVFSVMWRMDATLTMVALSVVPAMVLVLRRSADPMIERSHTQQEVEGRQYELVEQTLSAMVLVQAFGAEGRARERLRDTNASILAATERSASVQYQFKLLLGLTTALGSAAIVWVGARQVIAGTSTIGDLLVFIAYLTSLYGPLAALIYVPSSIHTAAGSARRVLDVLDEQSELPDRPGAPPLPPLEGHVRFDRVTAGYDAEPVLCDVTLDAMPGERVAIVGASGAGKSTLVSLVARFVDPLEGRVLLDGHDVRSVQLKSVRSQVAVLPQEPWLFPISIADNIAYGRPAATRADIERAARVANAHDFITHLPEGYDAVVGERGATLSGGERQRVAIARALLKDAPVLILDEPTSSMDSANEAVVLDALGKLITGRTTFIIAHRLSTIHDADRIVVLEHGRVAEIGTHHQLLGLGGAYARMHALQYPVHAAPVAPGLA